MRRTQAVLGFLAGTLLVAAVVYGAYAMLTFQTDVTVTESITSADALVVTASLGPGEMDNRTVTLENGGANPIDVTITGTVSPSGTGVTVVVTPGTLTIPSTGGASATFDVDIVAAADAVPGNYTVQVIVER